jgi:phage shock protein A
MFFETHQLPVPAADLRKRLEPLVRKTQAFKKRIAHKGIWVEPKLLAEIEYRAKSAEGIRQLQRAGISTASAEALLERMLTKIDAMCAERDKLKKELGPVKGRVLGGRSWHV